MTDDSFPQSNLRVAVVAADLITASALFALLSDQDDMLPIAQIESSSYASAPAYDPDVVLWDLGWTVDADALRDALGGMPGEGSLQDLPVLALVSDATQAGLAWRSGARSILLRSASPATLVAALHAVANGLWTLSPQASNAISIAGTDETLFEMEELTEREREVLALVAEGLTNRGIAQRLSISEHTVKFHVNSILAKLGAESRTDAVVRATRAGLILL